MSTLTEKAIRVLDYICVNAFSGFTMISYCWHMMISTHLNI